MFRVRREVSRERYVKEKKKLKEFLQKNGNGKKKGTETQIVLQRKRRSGNV